MTERNASDAREKTWRRFQMRRSGRTKTPSQETVPMIIDNAAFHDEGYVIPPEGKAEMEILQSCL